MQKTQTEPINKNSIVGRRLYRYHKEEDASKREFEEQEIIDKVESPYGKTNNNEILGTHSSSLLLTDKINPPHYKQGNIEVCDFIIDQKLDYLEGNIIKYVCRYKRKNGLEDLEKARWYLNKLIEQVKQK